MIVRAIDLNGDWLFGKGQNDYKSGNDAIAQTIKTRLLSFLGDCFFSTTDGIDWFNLLGSKNQLALQLAVSTMILNTENVTGILAVSVSLTDARVLTVEYKAQTVYSTLTDTFDYDFSGLV
jgi:hypothetical protein